MEWIIIIFLFWLGAATGSFLNVAIYRLPRGGSVLFPARSFCPACGRTIRAWDNIPLLSWLILRGRCRDCGVRISPRYLLVEAGGAGIFVGLYVAYFLFDVRRGTGSILTDWPMYTAHVSLLCGLLVCSIVDAKFFIIPLEVMWVCAGIGIVAAGVDPHPFLLQVAVAPEWVAASLAAGVGLGISHLLVRWGYLVPSFIDAVEPPLAPEPRPGAPDGATVAPSRDATAGTQVAFGPEHGVAPRREILREVAYLAPAALLAGATVVVLRRWEGGMAVWGGLFDFVAHPLLGPRMAAVGAAVFGLLVGGLCVWAVRILGTLAFNKEAMGMGDVHLLAAVGAVTGWFIPTVTFFVAPFLGLLWAMFLWIFRRQRELPYGPWLAGATLIVLLFHDAFASRLAPLVEAIQFLVGQ